MPKNYVPLLPALIAAAVLLGACGHRKPAPSESTASTAPRAEKAPRAAEAESKPAPADKVEKVEDDGKTGEVRGTPAADSKFTQLRMGMSMKEVIAVIGKPTDKHSYITGKGFWSSSGPDNYRQEFIYKGLGRLTFSSNGGLSLESQLIRIIHNADEKGTRS